MNSRSVETRSPAGGRGWLATVAIGCLAACAVPPPSPIALVDRTSEAGLPSDVGLCLATVDLDRDGAEDLLTTVHESENRYVVTIFHNEGEGRFSAIPLDETVSRSARCAVGDFDADGLVDLVLADQRSVFLDRNLGDFRFAPMPLDVAFDPPAEVWVVNVFDADADGRLDLYLAFDPKVREFTCDPGALDDRACRPTTPPTLYAPAILVRRGQAFRALPDSGLTPGWVNAANFIDIDGDGWTDIFETVEFSPPNRFWRNRHDGTFEDILPRASHAAALRHGMGAAFADFEGAGRWDAYLALIGPDQLWSGFPDGEDLAPVVGVVPATARHVGWSPVAVDFDDDGDADLYVANSAQFDDAAPFAQLLGQRLAAPGLYARSQHDDLFENRLHDEARLVATSVPNPRLRPSIAPAYVGVFDPEGDGREDLAVVNDDDGGPILRYLHNETAIGRRHWLDVRLRGRGANRRGLGATVTLLAGGREIGRGAMGSVGLASSARRLHFGLGETAVVDTIRVLWPGGTVQEEPAPRSLDEVVLVRER